MTDLEKILWTAAATIVGGAIIFVFGQLASRFFIEPWYEQRKVVGAIAESLLNYAHMLANSMDLPPERTQDVGEKFRKLAAELMARTVAIPGYACLAALGLARSRTDISSAARGLIGISNTLNRSDWERKLSLARTVAVSLGIDGIDPLFGKEALEGHEDGQHT